MNGIENMKAVLTAVTAALTALWGWMGWLIIAWIVAMTIDYITGSAAASRAGEWSSTAARDGIRHKFGDVAVVLIAGLLDLVVSCLLNQSSIDLPFEYSVLLCPLVCIWYIITEAGSIVENAGRMGARVPPWLARRIKSMQELTEQRGDEDE